MKIDGLALMKSLQHEFPKMITLEQMAEDIYLLTVDGRNEMAKKMDEKVQADNKRMGFRTDVAGALIGMKSAYLAKPAILLTGLDNISLHMALYPIVKMLHG